MASKVLKIFNSIKPLRGFIGVDTDTIETIDAKIVAVSDMGDFKVALISLGFDQVNNWISKLDGLSLKLSVSDDAPPVAAHFKYLENSWDLRYFPVAAKEAQLQCLADHKAVPWLARLPSHNRHPS